MMDPLPVEFAELQAICRGYQRSQALAVAAELGVADLLRDGPRPVAELGAATGAHAASLYRLLRALAAIGVLHEDAERRFALTAMGEFLRADHPLSLAPVVRMFCSDYEWRMWGELGRCVRTGESAAVGVLGTDVWEYRRRHPEHGETFDAAMRTLARSTTTALLAAHDFSRYRVLADIGGGTGGLLAALLAAVPDMRGVLFDQATVVAQAEPVLDAAGVADRVEIVAGSFFERVPGDADGYLLRRVLHDWSDDDAARILRSVRAATPDGARVLVLEAVVGPPNTDPLATFLDLMMMVGVGGRERTEAEWAALLGRAGFTLDRVTPASANLHVIEALPN